NSIFDEGFLGVSFFFILSGFILSYNYKEKFLIGNISKKEFYISRLARVYPVHIATTALVLLLTFIQSGKGWEYLRSEEHTSELQSRENLVCRLLLEKKKKKTKYR